MDMFFGKLIKKKKKNELIILNYPYWVKRKVIFDDYLLYLIVLKV